MLAGHDTRTSWGAQRMRSVGVCKQHPITREPIDIGRLVVLAAIGSGVHPAEIVDEQEDNVGWRMNLFGRLGIGRRKLWPASYVQQNPREIKYG